MSTILGPSPLWRRFAAVIYDSLLLIAISMGYGGLCLAISTLIFNDQTALEGNLLFQLGWLAQIISFYCFFWMKAGQTLGMRAWRLKVVDRHSQSSPSLIQCLGRCLLGLIGLTLCFTAFFNKERRCLHDTMTQSMVVLTPKEKS